MARQRELPIVPVLAGLGGLVYFAYYFREGLVPFELSFALAYLANPLLNVFEARGMRRDRVVILLYLLISLAISGTASFLLPTATKELSLLQSQAPVYFAKTKDFLAHTQAEIARRLPIGKKAAEHWSLQMYDPAVKYLEKLPEYVLSLFPLLTLLFLVPFITFYFLTDSTRLMRKAIDGCPGRWVEQMLHIATEIDTSMGNYVRSVLIETLAVTVLSFLGLAALGVNYSLAIAILSGVANVIPFAGPVLGGGVASLVALFQFENVWAVPKIIALFGGIRLVDDLVLRPVISQHSVDLHPVTYLLALMIGGEAFGFVGLILGVPAACIIKSLLQVGWDWYASEILQRIDAPTSGIRIPYV